MMKHMCMYEAVVIKKDVDRDMYQSFLKEKGKNVYSYLQDHRNLDDARWFSNAIKSIHNHLNTMEDIVQ